MKLFTTQAEKISEALQVIRTSLVAQEKLSAVEALCDVHREHMTMDFLDTVDLLQYDDQESFDTDRDKRIGDRIKILYNI